MDVPFIPHTFFSPSLSLFQTINTTPVSAHMNIWILYFSIKTAVKLILALFYIRWTFVYDVKLVEMCLNTNGRVYFCSCPCPRSMITCAWHKVLWWLFFCARLCPFCCVMCRVWRARVFVCLFFLYTNFIRLQAAGSLIFIPTSTKHLWSSTSKPFASLILATRFKIVLTNSQRNSTNLFHFPENTKTKPMWVTTKKLCGSKYNIYYIKHFHSIQNVLYGKCRTGNVQNQQHTQLAVFVAHQQH